MNRNHVIHQSFPLSYGHRQHPVSSDVTPDRLLTFVKYIVTEKHWIVKPEIHFFGADCGQIIDVRYNPLGSKAVIIMGCLSAPSADFDPPIKDWRKLASSWRPRKGWALALPFYDLPTVPGRMGLFKAARELSDPPPYHDEFLRGVRDTEARLHRFAEQVEAMGMKELPHGINHGVVLLGKQDFDLMVADADDYVYEPRIGDLGRLLHVIMYEVAMPGHPGYDKAKLVLDAFQRHVALSEPELRALPWVCMSFALFYRVFHVLLYLGEVEDNPEGARYLVPDLSEKLSGLTEQEAGIEKLTGMLSGSSCRV